MAEITQSGHLLEIDTPLGKDALILTDATISEGISQLFHAQLSLFSSTTIAPDDLIGKPVTITLRASTKQEPRYLHGYVSHFSVGLKNARGHRQYEAEVVPWLWFLSHTSNCQIFQSKTALDIVELIFKQLGFSDFKAVLKGDKPRVREYCVQYNETALNFVSRLLEEEGIFYYFKHEKGKHTLILANQAQDYEKNSPSKLLYSEGTCAQNSIHYCSHEHTFCSGKFAHAGYNFEKPASDMRTSLNSTVKLPKNDKYEKFEHIVNYQEKKEVTALTKHAAEAEEAHYESMHGTSDIPQMTPGYTFELETKDDAIKEKNTSSSPCNTAFTIKVIPHMMLLLTHLPIVINLCVFHRMFPCGPNASRPNQG